MSDKDKPPDDYYKSIKLPLKNVVSDKSDRKIILSAVSRTNKIIVKTYLLLRLWILNKYHTNNIIPKITEDTIITCMQTLNLHHEFFINLKFRLRKTKFKNLETRG